MYCLLSNMIIFSIFFEFIIQISQRKDIIYARVFNEALTPPSKIFSLDIQA